MRSEELKDGIAVLPQAACNISLKISWHLKHGRWVNKISIFYKGFGEHPGNERFVSLASIVHKPVKAAIGKRNLTMRNTISLGRVTVISVKARGLSGKLPEVL